MRKNLFLIYILLCLTLFSGDARRVKLDINGEVLIYSVFNGEHYIGTQEGILRYGKDGNFLNRIGKKGEGPGELKFFTFFGFVNSRVIISNANKINIFELDGKLVEEKPNPLKMEKVIMLTADLLLGQERDMSPDKNRLVVDITQQVVIYDLKNKRKIPLFTSRYSIPQGFQFAAVEPLVQARFCEKNKRIYVSDPGSGYFFRIFDLGGKPVHDIIREGTKPVPIEEDFRNDFFTVIFSDPRFKDKSFMEEMKKKIYFPKNFPAFHSFNLDEDGNILVRTFKHNGDKEIFDCLSPDGKWIEAATVQGRTFDVTTAERYYGFSKREIWRIRLDEVGDYFLERSTLEFPQKNDAIK